MGFTQGGAVDLGTAYGRVVLDGSSVSGSIGTIQAQISQYLGTAGQLVSGVGVALTAATAPLLLFGRQGVSTAGDFEAAMLEIEARTGATAEQMELMRQTAIQMGADTVFGATDAANSFLQLLTSGLEVNEALAVLPQVLDGAAASGENLANVADWTTDIMAAYNLEAGQAKTVIDTLTRAAGSGSATFGDLAAGFQNVGGMAALMGLDVEQTAGILQVFSENGIKGAEAGTQLRSMLNNMTRDTDDVVAMWDRLGVSLYDSEGGFRDMRVVMRELGMALDDLSPQERAEALRTLGGAYGQLGLAALTGGEQAGRGLQSMIEAMRNATDTATVAATRMEGWKGATENLSGSIETFQIEVLLPFMANVLTPLVGKLTDAVNAVTDWARENPELMNTILSVILALGILGPVLVIVGKGLALAAGLVSGLGTAFSLLTSPIGLAIAAGALLVWAYTNNFGGLKDFIDTEVRPRLESFFNWLGGVWEDVQPSLNALKGWFTETGLPAVRDMVNDQVKPRMEEFFGVLSGAWTTIEPQLTPLVDWFTTTGLPTILTFIADTALSSLQSFVNVFATIWDVVNVPLSNLVNWFTTEGLPGAISFVTDTAIPEIERIRNIMRGLWLAVQPHLNNLKRWFDETGMPAIQTAIELVTGAWETVRDTMQSIWEAVRGPLQNFANQVQTILQPVTDFIGGIAEKIGAVIRGLEELGRTGGRPGGATPGDPNSFLIPGMASGGPVRAGSPYIVGEEGPELFLPGSSGAIIPNDVLQGLGRQTMYQITIEPGAIALTPIPGMTPGAQAVNFLEALEDEINRRG